MAINKEEGASDISKPDYGTRIWNVKGAYAVRLGIGPDVIQALISFPLKQEFNRHRICSLIPAEYSRLRRILHCPSRIRREQNLCGT